MQQDEAAGSGDLCSRWSLRAQGSSTLSTITPDIQHPGSRKVHRAWESSRGASGARPVRILLSRAQEQLICIKLQRRPGNADQLSTGQEEAGRISESNRFRNSPTAFGPWESTRQASLPPGTRAWVCDSNPAKLTSFPMTLNLSGICQDRLK